MPMLPTYRNQSIFTGFYMRATLVLNGLSSAFKKTSHGENLDLQLVWISLSFQWSSLSFVSNCIKRIKENKLTSIVSEDIRETTCFWMISGRTEVN